jgi:hypothetical protein
MSMMVHIGNLSRPMQVSDDLSYDYIVVSLDQGDQRTIRLDPKMRNATSRWCSNGTFPLRGGNPNCTIYIGVQCTDLCVYNLSVNATTTSFSKTNVPTPIEPLLL